MATYTNKNGTASADTLTYNKAGTYHAGAGNDTIKITGGSGVVIYTDSGNNIINVTSGSNHTVKVAAVDADSDKQNGVEKLIINGANEVGGYLGSGKDEITLANTDGRRSTGALAAIHGGGWTDTFTVNTGAQRYQLYGDAGDDIFNINNGSNIVCWGGAANDTFNVIGGTGIKLRGGDSADVYNISAAGVDMQLGYGNDVVNVTGGSNQKIKGNLGINTINLKAGSNHVITADIDQAASQKAGKEVGYGVDKVNISGSANCVTANLGDGKDEVTVSAGIRHNIYTEGWGDTLNISGTASSSTFDAGAGDDIINISGGTANTVAAGEGNDTVTVTSGNVTQIKLGTGNDDITVSGGSVEQLYTTSGKNTITVAGSGAIEKLYLGNQYEDIKITGGKISSIDNSNDAQIKFVMEGGQAGSIEGLVGSSKYDNISIKGGKISLIQAGAGDDDIWYTGGSVSFIKGGMGDDSIYVTTGSGTGAYIYGDEGDDIIVVKTPKEATYTHYIFGGAGEDNIAVSGYGHNVIGGTDDDTVTLTDGAKNITVWLEDGDDRALSQENTTIDSITIYGDNAIAGKDRIELKGVVTNSNINGDSGNDTILVGNSQKLSKNNKLKGGYGNDTISCINTQYALVEGGADNDTITCTKVTYGVIYGDSATKSSIGDADTIYLNDVSQSFISGASYNSNPVTNDTNSITISGNCSKDIIFGGYGANTLWVNGAMTNSILFSGKSKDEISITREGCQYNKIFGGGNDDTYRITAGSYNTIKAGNGYDTFYISGGKNNLFMGGSSGDQYNVSTYGQNYNMIDDFDGYNTINVNYNSKLLIATNKGVVNIYGAKLKDFEIKYNDEQYITRFNDIYIYSSGRFNPTINIYDGTMSNPGALTTTFKEEKLYEWGAGISKYGTLTEMRTTWDLLESQMGESNKAIGIGDLENEINMVLDSVQNDINMVYSYISK